MSDDLDEEPLDGGAGRELSRAQRQTGAAKLPDQTLFIALQLDGGAVERDLRAKHGGEDRGGVFVPYGAFGADSGEHRGGLGGGDFRHLDAGGKLRQHVQGERVEYLHCTTPYFVA